MKNTVFLIIFFTLILISGYCPYAAQTQKSIVFHADFSYNKSRKATMHEKEVVSFMMACRKGVMREMAEINREYRDHLFTFLFGEKGHKMRQRQRWSLVLSVVLTVTMAFSNVCPAVYAAGLDDQAAAVTEDEQRMVATPSNTQKPIEEEPEFEEELENDRDFEERPEEDEDDPEEEFVGVWSDKPPIIPEGETEFEPGYDELPSSTFGAARDGLCPTYEEAYNAMVEMKEELYEGRPWTNFVPYGRDGELGPYYRFQGGAVKGGSLGVGCAAFAFILSDAAFDNLPARTIDRGDFQYDDVKVGDILRVNNNHFVIILRVGAGGVTVAEGNHNKSVHWGRSLSKSEVLNANFIVTRYPAGYSEEADADEVFQSGTEGSLTWTLTNGGTLTVSGSGTMPDYTESNGPSWNEHSEKISSVIIEDGVKNIGNYAFCKSSAMNVYIPETVTNIGTGAFKQSNLMEITVPGSVKAVGDEAFYDCKELRSATFHDGVQSIGIDAFRGCGIGYLDFPASITSVGAGAFMECTTLVQVRFAPGKEVVHLGDNLFSKCWLLSNVTLPLKADKISSGMFTKCYMALTYLYIPAGVEVDGIGSSGSPFAGCDQLQRIDFGGTESEWQANGGTSALIYAGMKDQVTVNYNVTFDDPFAEIPDDPGEFVVCEHIDADSDGKCDKCGEEMTSSEKPVVPDTPGEDGTCTGHVDADGDGKCDKCGAEMTTKPVNPGGNTGGSTGNGSGSNSGGTSGGSSGGSGGSGGGSNGTGGSSGGSSDSVARIVSEVVSTDVTMDAAGAKITTTKWSDGTVVTVVTDSAGAESTKVELSKLLTETARQDGRAVTLPITGVQPAGNLAEAMAITVHAESLTAEEPLVKVLIPVTTPGMGTVAMMVNPDGTVQLLRNSTPVENGIVMSVPNGATVKLVDSGKKFTDVPVDAWYKEAVDYVTARDLFYGVTETTFNPAAHMTCGTLIMALARLDDIATDNDKTWYEKSVQWAVARGLISDGFDPENTATSELIAIYSKYFDMDIRDELPAALTRAEAAQMLLNLKKCKP